MEQWSTSNRFPGGAVPGHEQYPRHGSPQAPAGLAGVPSAEWERVSGQMGSWVPGSLLERLHVASQNLQGNELSPSEAGRMPCLPSHLGFKHLSHTLGVAAKYCASCTSLHLDFKPLQLVFGSGFQAFSSPISYPHWFPL